MKISVIGTGLTGDYAALCEVVDPRSPKAGS